ncbi:diacylglycerol acyltransferase [Achlya hypogyna]|uniref:Acyltransferase n=1 Tax=Achlya hypogyna TaxID=1202772 RepID=A0A1V9Z344_ACHHY|nr:diacylglycerol acyltransferase [Achlya hypogyna]
MKIVATGLVFFLYTCWLGGCALFLSMVAGLAVASCRVYILGAFAAYYSFRYLVPKQAWPAFLEFFQNVSAKHPYFKAQAVHFEVSEVASAKATKTLFAFHPHGAVGGGWLVNGIISQAFSACKNHWLVFDALMKVPLTGDVFTWLRIDGAGKATFLRLMAQEKNIALIPGGFEEATTFEHGVHRVYLQKRKGFIKLALVHGYQVVPVYSFGEEFTVRSYGGFAALRVWLNRFKIPSALFIGQWFCFYLPKNDLAMHTVVGPPLVLPTIPTPSNADVQKYHQLYIDALVGLFNRHKAAFAADPNATLQVL